MREQLIRYLLGELDDFERRELQAKLRVSPKLQQELAHLKECFAANQDDDEEPQAPGRLAERTAERITSVDSDDDWDLVSPRSKTLVTTSEPPAGVLGWSLADLTVAGGVMLAVSMLVFPALRDSRDGTRRNVCQNNQREMFVLVSQHARDHGGNFPQVRPNETAGVFAARLVAKGYVQPQDLSVLLVCPGAPLAKEIRSGQFTIHIPAREVLREMSPSKLAEVTAGMSPFYAYRFPYRVGDDYQDIRDDGLTFSPLFCDASGDVQGVMSPNHGGQIIQVMCRNGGVKAFTTSTLPGVNDELFRNDLGLRLAGVRPQDVVMGNTDAMPGLDFSPEAR